MKHRFSRQPGSSAKQERGVFPVHFLEKKRFPNSCHWPLCSNHARISGLKGRSQALVDPTTWGTRSDQQGCFNLPLTTRTSAECLKTCRCQNGTFSTQAIFVLQINSHTKVQSSVGKCHLLLLHIEKAAATQYSSFSLHTDLLLQRFPHLIRSLLPTYFENMIMFLCKSSLDSHLQGPSMPLLTRCRKQEALFYGTRLHWHTSR